MVSPEQAEEDRLAPPQACEERLDSASVLPRTVPQGRRPCLALVLGLYKASLCLVISPPGRWIRWVLGIQETTRQTQTLPLGKADSRQVLGTSHSRQDSGADSCRAGLSVLLRTCFQAAAQVLMLAL